MPQAAGAPETADRRRRSLLLLALALGTAALPLVGLARRLPAAQRTDYSIGDLAIVELSVVEADRGERLVGQASRFGFYQVGPSHLYLQVPLYRLFSHRRFALSLTCLLVNWAALVGMLYALGRWLDSGAALLVAPFVALPYFGYYESATLFNYWGQYLIVLPAALFLFTAAAVATGRARAWPLLLALGSFLVQGYGSSLPPVLAVLAAVAGSAGLRAWRRRGTVTPGGRGGHPGKLTAIAVSLLVLALFWSPTVIDEWTRAPGNLSRMVAHYSSTAPRSHPPAAAIVASLSRHLAAPWLHALWGLTVNSVPSGGQARAAVGLSALLVLLLALGTGLAARRGQRYSAALCALCLLTVAAAFAAARQLDGDIVPYVFFWLSAVAAVGWLAALAVLLRSAVSMAPLLPALRAAARHREAWLLALALALALSLLVRPLAIPHLGDASVGAFAAGLEGDLAARGLAGRPLRLVSHDFAWPWALGLLIQLDQRRPGGHRVSIANVQGTTAVAELQGLGKSWLTPLPGSTEVHLYDKDRGRDAGPAGGEARILCHPVLPLDATKPEMCLYRGGV